MILNYNINLAKVLRQADLNFLTKLWLLNSYDSVCHKGISAYEENDISYYNFDYFFSETFIFNILG